MIPRGIFRVKPQLTTSAGRRNISGQHSGSDAIIKHPFVLNPVCLLSPGPLSKK